MKSLIGPLLAMLFLVTAIGTVVFMMIDKPRQERDRLAWLTERGCKRTTYHADSLRGIWSCPNGEVYMLRDVPVR